MKLRSGLALLAGLVITAGACAPSSSGGARAAEPAAPSGRIIPEGVAPRENMHTRSAALYLTQGQTNPNPDQRRQRFEEALQAAKSGIALDGGNPRSYFQGGRASLGLGDLVGADSLFTRAEQLYPRYVLETAPLRQQQWVEAYNAAVRHLDAGDAQEAIQLFERANTIYRDRPEAYLNLGAAHSQVGNVDDAVAAYQTALSVIRGPASEDLNEATLEAWRENEEIAIFNIAQTFAQAGRDEEAAEAYMGYLERDPEHVGVQSNLAITLVRLGRAEEAMGIYDRLLAQDDLTGQEYFTAGIGLFQIERYERAGLAFRRAWEVNPSNRDALYNLSQTLFLTDSWEALVPVGRELVERDPYNQNVYRILAQALVRTNQQQEAVRYLERAEALPFEITNTMLQPRGRSGARLSGDIYNISLEPGTPVRVRFTFIGDDGEDAGTVEIEVAAPAVEEGVAFQAELEEGVIVGYRYEVL